MSRSTPKHKLGRLVWLFWILSVGAATSAGGGLEQRARETLGGTQPWQENTLPQRLHEILQACFGGNPDDTDGVKCSEVIDPDRSRASDIQALQARLAAAGLDTSLPSAESGQITQDGDNGTGQRADKNAISEVTTSVRHLRRRVRHEQEKPQATLQDIKPRSDTIESDTTTPGPGDSRTDRELMAAMRENHEVRRLVIGGLEYSSLSALYSSFVRTDTNTNWMTNDPCTFSWYGITCSGTTNVVEISLYNEEYTGTLPSQIGLLSKLTSLLVGRNNLYSTIPSQLGDCTALSGIFLGYNSFSGTLPSQLAPSHIAHNIQAVGLV